jgi:hypothetical protein
MQVVASEAPPVREVEEGAVLGASSTAGAQPTQAGVTTDMDGAATQTLSATELMPPPIAGAAMDEGEAAQEVSSVVCTVAHRRGYDGYAGV